MRRPGEARGLKHKVRPDSFFRHTKASRHDRRCPLRPRIIARDWLFAAFYVRHFGCSAVPPESAQVPTSRPERAFRIAALRFFPAWRWGPTLEVFSRACRCLPPSESPGYGLCLKVDRLDARQKVSPPAPGSVGDIVTLDSHRYASWCCDRPGGIFSNQSWRPRAATPVFVADTYTMGRYGAIYHSHKVFLGNCGRF